MIDEPSQNAISSVVIFFQRSSVNATFALVKISQQESKHTPALEPYRILQGSLKRKTGGSNARYIARLFLASDMQYIEYYTSAAVNPGLVIYFILGVI